jgi:hypothetical protein
MTWKCFILRIGLILEMKRRQSNRYGIIGDESNLDAGCAPFLFQSFLHVAPPPLQEDIIS